MPISLHQIATNTAKMTITIDDSGELTVIYYPSRFTERMVADMQQIATLNEETLVDGFHKFNVSLAHLMKDWDLYEDAEMQMKFPIDPERFPELPLMLRTQIFNGIAGNMRPEMFAPQTT